MADKKTKDPEEEPQTEKPEAEPPVAAPTPWELQFGEKQP
jgi:hypothetical protein